MKQNPGFQKLEKIAQKQDCFENSFEILIDIEMWNMYLATNDERNSYKKIMVITNIKRASLWCQKNNEVNVCSKILQDKLEEKAFLDPPRQAENCQEPADFAQVGAFQMTLACLTEYQTMVLTVTLEEGDLAVQVLQELVVMAEQIAFAGSVTEALVNSLQGFQDQQTDTVEMLEEQIAEMDASGPLAGTIRKEQKIVTNCLIYKSLELPSKVY